MLGNDQAPHRWAPEQVPGSPTWRPSQPRAAPSTAGPESSPSLRCAGTSAAKAVVLGRTPCRAPSPPSSSCMARGARAEPGGAGLFGVTRRCSFSRHQRADGRLPGSPRNPEWAIEEDSASAGAPPETTAAARDPTDVACSECVAEAVGAADGSAVEGLHAVGTMPLYARPVVLAAGRATQQRDTPAAHHLLLD